MQTVARLLIVEDHDATRDTLVLLFEKEGFVARGAGTFAQAAESFATDPPAVALIDIGLPDGSGLDLVQSFVAKQPDIRVIVVTASDDHNLHRESMKRGACCFIHKPYGFADLRDAVQAALDPARPGDTGTKQSGKAGTKRHS